MLFRSLASNVGSAKKEKEASFVKTVEEAVEEEEGEQASDGFGSVKESELLRSAVVAQMR